MHYNRRISVNFDCRNAAFDEDAAAEVCRILRELAARIEQDGLDTTTPVGQGRHYPLRDINGNTVGQASIS